MANLSYKLELLFRQYLIRKEKERTTPRYNYGFNNSGYSGFGTQSWLTNRETYDGVIYFYEWSDPDRAPQLFYTIGAFDEYLRRCGIYMLPYQKDIIFKLERAYVTCKKGCKELLIRGGLGLLRDALGENNPPALDVKTVGEVVKNQNLPAPTYPAYGGFNNRRPPMYNEEVGSWYG